MLNGRAAYWALVAAMDAMIGRILNALRENGLADNTLVVYSSDHGDLVGEHDLWMKRTFYEESVKVPAILSWPGVLPCGSECHRVMSALDLNAAMLQALGAPALPNSPGRPALELLRTGAGAWEDLAFSEYALREKGRYIAWCAAGGGSSSTTGRNAPSFSTWTRTRASERTGPRTRSAGKWWTS